jgi:murein L,D-transpeptidase YcbB/YkuD
MFLRTFGVVFLVLLLTGCATTSTTVKSQTQQVNEQIKELQDKVRFLEQELQSRGKQVSELEMELDKIKKTTGSTQPTKTAPVVKNLSIRQIQTALKNAGFYNGAIDGKEGNLTRAAIKRFQRKCGLKADGIVGKRTAAELAKYLDK